jgi:hypothetical protein
MNIFSLIRMFGLPTSVQLSSNPVVTAVLPGSNITVNKNIGDVTVSSGGGGGGGTQTNVSAVFEAGNNDLSTAPTFDTLTTLTVITTAPNSLITITHGFLTNSDGSTYVILRTLVNGAVISASPLQLQMSDDVSSGTLSLFYRAAAAGTYAIVLEGTRTGGFRGGVTDIFSSALSNLNG